MGNDTDNDIGRPVRITSIGFANGKRLQEIVAVVDREGTRGTDLIALPETWLGQHDHAPETLDGPTIPALASLARKHRTYIVCPLDRWDGQRRLNSAVLLDGQGRVACVYDKVYPFWSEYDVEPKVTVGQNVPVYQADFGRVGMAICFDVNFPEVWKRLADQGAELVIWPSAYSAGTSLQAHALNHHYYVATATQKADCVVYDITGEEILYERSDDLNVSRFTLDLDRGIYHEDFNLEKRERLLQEHGDDVWEEKHLTREAWFVLKARRAGVSARALARQYGLEELRDYLDRSRREIDRLRGGACPGAMERQRRVESPKEEKNMDEGEFRQFLKRQGKKAQVVENLVGQVNAFGAYLAQERGKGLEDAEAQDLHAYAAALDEHKPGQAGKQIRGLILYYQFTGNAAMASLAGGIRGQAVARTRTPFALKDFRGVDQAHIARLKAAGIANVEQMRQAGSTPESRQRLADQTGIPSAAILELVKLSDLARIQGMKGVRARLYYDAGVDTLERLGQWEPEALRTMLAAFVERTGFDGIAPLPKEVRHAVATAQQLPKVVQYEV